MNLEKDKMGQRVKYLNTNQIEVQYVNSQLSAIKLEIHSLGNIS